MSAERWLWLIAGPNGAGKSTRAAEVLGGLGEIVNPDEIAREISVSAPEEGLTVAGRAAIERRRQLLRFGNSFSIETTLSGRTFFRFAQDAGQEGWKIGRLYVGLRSPEQAIERVQLRVKSGGHHVPPEDVRRRYERGLANLPAFLQIVDRALVFDNSLESGPLKLLEIENHKITFAQRRPPNWLQSSLGKLASKKSRTAKRKKKRKKNKRRNEGDSNGLQSDHL